MKNTALILSIFSASVFSSNAQYTLTLKITNLKTNKGIVRVQLFDVNHKTVTKVTSLVEKDEVKLLLTNIPSGKYAIQ